MAKSPEHKSYAVCVTGGGLVGLTAALQLANICSNRGHRLALIAPTRKDQDKRTTAMMMPSIDVLKNIGVWEGMEEHSAGLKTMRLIDGSNRLIRAPVTDFRSLEMGMEAFGYNVPNERIISSLEKAISQHPAIDRFPTLLSAAECETDAVHLELATGEIITAQLAVAADGRKSILRESAGIKVRKWSYPQTALVLNFSHSRPHGGVSTEFHTETGPFTQVPLPANRQARHRSSLVWVVEPHQVEELQEKPLPELSEIIETRLQSCFGAVSVEASPQAFPLSGMSAHKFAANRVALVGEAGHFFPPIGAQGFNLGLRDVTGLNSALESVKSDFGNVDIINSYSRRRIFDIHSRTGGVDLLNRSLLTDFLPVQAARAFGLSALGNITWLRKLAMRHGLGASDTRSRAN